MIDALLDGARAIEASPEARVAILSGEGKAFCAGGDIAAWGGLQPLEMWRDWMRAGHRAFEALARLRVPLIAALTGHAFGGGLELAAVGGHSHRRERNQARPARNRPRHGAGLVRHAAAGATAFGGSVVRRMALRGAMFTAEEGLWRSAWSTRWSRRARALRARSLARDIAKRGPVAVQMVKR